MRIFFLLIALTLIPNLGLALDNNQQEKDARGNLSPELETALTNLIKATRQKNSPNLDTATQTVLDFINTNAIPAAKIHPNTRSYGHGVYFAGQIKQPLNKLMEYILEPKIPGEALYPASVRRNTWKSGDILTNSDLLKTADLPPKAMLITGGIEYEETTPDTSSGCFYSYDLNRLFILMPINGRSALFSISYQPSASNIGLKGYIIEPDTHWNYVYTHTKGTNLPLLGWAETQVYGSASITVFLESATQSNSVDVHIFKWVKGGWSGMNVIKPSHIQAGLERFLLCLKTIMESPELPQPEAIIQEFQRLQTLSVADLTKALMPLSIYLSQKSAELSLLRSADFAAVIANNAYGASLSPLNARVELIKQYMQTQIGHKLPY